MDRILKKYNVIGDDLFYHHTVSECTGEIYYTGTEAHRQYEILYLIRGSISYIIEGSSYLAKPGDIIFVAPDEIHTLKIDGRQSYERAVILFDMDIIRNMLSRINVELMQFSRDSKNRIRIIDGATVKKHKLDEILLSIIELDGEEKYKKLEIVSRLIDFIVSLDKIACERGDRLLNPSSEDTLVRSAIDYIDTHLTEKISLDGLASALFVSKSTLCHRFSSYLKMTPNRYITVRKMHLAEKLMRDGMSASEAACAVGYDNYSGFYYNYKQIIGTSPSESAERS